MGIGFLHRSLRHLLRESWKPHAIYFTHAAPRRKELHRRFFGTQRRIQSGVQRHPLSARDLDTAVPAADATMARYVQRYLDTLAARRNSTIGASVRECIHLMLPSGLCSADHVARRLGADRRTVNRHLEREGETFWSIVISVRAELVTRYIDNRGRPLASVGAA